MEFRCKRVHNKEVQSFSRMPKVRNLMPSISASASLFSESALPGHGGVDQTAMDKWLLPLNRSRAFYALVPPCLKARLILIKAITLILTAS
jgi:hypothetical protein